MFMAMWVINCYSFFNMEFSKDAKVRWILAAIGQEDRESIRKYLVSRRQWNDKNYI